MQKAKITNIANITSIHTLRGEKEQETTSIRYVRSGHVKVDPDEVLSSSESL